MTRHAPGTPAPESRPFLTARWESLLLLNFRCPPEVLEPLVPPGTELDAWEGRHLVSLVGFRFLDARVLGAPLLGSRSFEEVNLRFYVNRRGPEGRRRGVVFIRELVPTLLVAAAARAVYNEPYLTAAMSHEVQLDLATGGGVRYSWSRGGEHHTISGRVAGPAWPLVSGSEAEFVTEHYWGYNVQRSGDTLEYRVEHPRWSVWDCPDASYSGPERSQLYEPRLAEVLRSRPVSAVVAIGSEVAVHRGARIERPG